ncbi:hypothetical protein RZS08_66765, partial [Arthrospira platensis SPKY1]|nr:hypothetical protein [Arthrospira platensis SPKY1]
AVFRVACRPCNPLGFPARFIERVYGDVTGASKRASEQPALKSAIPLPRGEREALIGNAHE